MSTSSLSPLLRVPVKVNEEPETLSLTVQVPAVGSRRSLPSGMGITQPLNFDRSFSGATMSSVPRHRPETIS